MEASMNRGKQALLTNWFLGQHLWEQDEQRPGDAVNPMCPRKGSIDCEGDTW